MEGKKPAESEGKMREKTKSRLIEIRGGTIQVRHAGKPLDFPEEFHLCFYASGLNRHGIKGFCTRGLHRDRGRGHCLASPLPSPRAFPSSLVSTQRSGSYVDLCLRHDQQSAL